MDSKLMAKADCSRDKPCQSAGRPLLHLTIRRSLAKSVNLRMIKIHVGCSEGRDQAEGMRRVRGVPFFSAVFLN